MHFPRTTTVVMIVAGICLILIVLMISTKTMVSLDFLYVYAEEHRIAGAVLLAVLMCVSTVFAPLAVLPIVPVIAPILGPFTTAVASYIGWMAGSLTAFWVARRYGQRVVLRFIKKESLEKMHTYIPSEMSFTVVLALRMLIPADALSYALGLFTNISYRTHTLATAIGIAWFSFAFSYLGDSAFSSNYVLLTGIGVASIALFYMMWRYMKHKKKV